MNYLSVGKVIAIYLLTLILVSCADTRSSFLDQQGVIESDILDKYYSGDEVTLEEVRNRLDFLNAKVKKNEERGRKKRILEYSNMPPHSKEFCLHSKLDRLEIAEIELLMASVNRIEYAESRKEVLSLISSAEDSWKEEKGEIGSDDQLLLRLKTLFSRNQQYAALSHWKNLQSLESGTRKYLQSIRAITLCEFKLKITEEITLVLNETNGWPKISEYGNEIDHLTFMLLHNTGHNMELLENALESIKINSKIGETKKTHYPNLYDVIATCKGEYQKFGWVIRCKDGVFKPDPPLLDPDKVNLYRAEYGLGPLEEQISSFPKTCDF